MMEKDGPRDGIRISSSWIIRNDSKVKKLEALFKELNKEQQT